ncbi:MAG: SH3 domain-containing protein [Chloroflexi bacterium]|nr:SH3 domain-containing protein [Chloroflexota bacterium]
MLNLALLTALLIPGAAQAQTCPGAPPTQLAPNTQGIIISVPGNNLRAEPSASAQIVAQVVTGTRLAILDGPVCADGANWWQVTTENVTAWTAEGMGSEYFVEPFFTRTFMDAREIADHISFTYTSTIATDAQARLVSAANTPDTPTGATPEYTEIAFQTFDPNFGGAVDNGQFLYVFPVSTFPADSPSTQQRDALQNLLAADPVTFETTVNAGNLPVLPFNPAQQVLTAQVRRLQFQSGIGIRFITAFAQDVAPVEQIFYTFQGLTNDGAYYVSAQFPLRTAALVPGLDAASAQQTLNALAPGEFVPDLTAIDTLIESIQVASPAATIRTPDGASGPVAVSFENISFSYDAALADRVEVEIIASPADSAAGQFEPPFGSTEFALFGYPMGESTIDPQVLVMPTGAFFGTGTEIDDNLSQLNELLMARPELSTGFDTLVDATYQPLPLLPPINAVQTFAVLPEYRDFGSGTGVRFLTFYSQAITPIDNQGLFYTFQGLSTDGRFAVAMYFPISAPTLPDRFIFDENFDTLAFNETYISYLGEVVGELSAVPNEQFIPMLADLDAVVESLVVQ